MCMWDVCTPTVLSGVPSRTNLQPKKVKVKKRLLPGDNPGSVLFFPFFFLGSVAAATGLY